MIRAFIENYLPVREISKEAQKEKSGRPPTFKAHYWWSRKPLVVTRAILLSSLLPCTFDKEEFNKLLGLNRERRAHNYGVDLNGLQRYYEDMWGTKSPYILDPFGGGGSIPFEAMQLGATVHCADYNPIAYIILKTALEYPQRYKEELIKDVNYWTEWRGL
jgi:adenine-specific DNA methylase